MSISNLKFDPNKHARSARKHVHTVPKQRIAMAIRPIESITTPTAGKHTQEWLLKHQEVLVLEGFR